MAAAVERRIVTSLFADLVGFTPLAERLDPEDVATVQDATFSTARATTGQLSNLAEDLRELLANRERFEWSRHDCARRRH